MQNEVSGATVRKRRKRPEELTSEQSDLYEKIASGPRAADSAFPLVDHRGALTGPFDAMLLVPALGDALQALGSAIRFRGLLTDRAREMTILFVGHHLQSAFEVSSHEAVARRIGLSDRDLAEISQGRAPERANDYEMAVTVVVLQLLKDCSIDDDVYASAIRTLSEELLFEINLIVGYYSLLATQIRLFDGATSRG